MAPALPLLAVETSCDECALAIYEADSGQVLANLVHSQIALHRLYGGVVPELAARDHLARLPTLLSEALRQAQLNLRQLKAVAYTAGPGLLGALLTGACYGKALAYGLDIPSLAVHHMEGHLLSPFLAAEKPEFPFVALLVSGGHSLLVAVRGLGQYELLGQTLDDAVGEAFDKTAKLLGLPYPGGPELAALATDGDPQRFPLPRPMTNRPGMDLSFSGLKTQVRLLIEERPREDWPDIAASFQAAVIDTLVIKCRRAWQATGFRDLVVAGGVSANLALREALGQEAGKGGRRVFFPPLNLCGDNALMIAHAAAWRYGKNLPTPDLNIQVRARWDLTSL